MNAKRRFSFCTLLILCQLSFCLLSISPLRAEDSSGDKSPIASSEGSAILANNEPEKIEFDRIGERSTADKDRCAKILEDIRGNITCEDIENKLKEISSQLKEFDWEDEKLVQSEILLEDWQSRAIVLDGYAKELSSISETLQKFSVTLKEDGDFIVWAQECWNLTKISVKSQKLNYSVVDSINSVILGLQECEPLIRKEQSNVVELQNKVYELNNQISGIKKDKEEAMDRNRERILKRSSGMIWEDFNKGLFYGYDDWNKSFNAKLGDLKEFWGKHGIGLSFYLVVWAVVWLILRSIHRVLLPLADNRGAIAKAMRILEIPMPIATLAMFGTFFYLSSSAPRLFYIIVAVIAFSPTIVVLRRVLDDYLSPMFVALQLAYTLSLARLLIEEMTVCSRLLTGIECLIMLAVAYYYLCERAYSSLGEEERLKVMRVSKTFAVIAIFAMIVAVGGCVLGYVDLANKLVNALMMLTLGSNLFWACAHVALALVLFITSVRPLCLLKFIEVKREHILELSRSILYFGVVLAVLEYGTMLFGYNGLVSSLWGAISVAEMTVGSISLSLKQVIIAVVVMSIAYPTSRIFMGLVTYDIAPRLEMQANSSNLALVFAQYIPLVIGICIACGALGLSMSNFTMVVGALSVGIGFGLQNIISNFVSGLILLFDPRIVVGGAVDFGGFSGILIHVGLRASVVRLYDGRELIVPNSSIIGQNVTCIRNPGTEPSRFDISFSLLEPVDVKKVSAIAMKVVEDHPGVAKDPASKLLMTGFDDGYPSFIFYVWSINYNDQLGIRSEISSRLADELEKNGIKLAHQFTWTRAGNADKVSAE